MKIIDISHWQGNVNFANVKNAGYQGVIIKAGGSDAGFYKDSNFEAYYNGAKNAGLCVGSYYFVGAGCVSTNDGKADGERFANLIKGKQFDLPVYMDVEAPPAGKKAGVTDAIIGFCSVMESKGYYVGVYASDISGFCDRIDYNRIKDRYTLWVARYGSKPTYVKKYDMWQYSSTGRVSGISGNVDLDECYKDFPSIIKKGGFNGYGKNTPVTPTPQPAPAPQPTTTTYTVQKGDTLSGIASRFGTTYQELARINGIADPNKIYPGEVLKINGTSSKPSSSAKTYTVKAGDTLSGIAKKFGTTYQKIAKDNGIKDPNKIYPNQKLIIK